MARGELPSFTALRNSSRLITNHRINNYTFNMDAMTSFEGDTGPYLQYAHSRLCSIKRRANLTEEDLQSADLSLLTEQHATNVVRMLSQWPDTVQNTLKTLEPTTVLTYLFKMSHAVSSSYDHLQVVGSEKELMKARMALYDAARIVLSNGMKLLGLTPLERYVANSLSVLVFISKRIKSLVIVSLKSTNSIKDVNLGTDTI